MKKNTLNKVDTDGFTYTLTFNKKLKPSKSEPFYCELVDKKGNLYLSGMATVAKKSIKIKLDPPVDYITVTYVPISKRKHS